MSDLFREAEDELRKETAVTVVKRAGPIIIVAIVLGLAGSAGWQYWQGEQSKMTEKAAIAYDAALAKLEAGDLTGGAAALQEVAHSGAAGFAAQAMLQRAAVLQELAKPAEALGAYEEAAIKIADADLADLARLRAAYIAADSETRDQINARLKPIIDRKGAFAPLARELAAGVAWGAGDKTAARSGYSLLQLDVNAPEGVRTRAGQAIAVIDAAATPSKIPLQFPTQPGHAQAGSTPDQIAQMQADQQRASGEATPENPRIVRLPPGVKLPPGTKIPPNVRVIETPLPAGGNVSGTISPEMLAQIERERQASMARQKAITEAQQRQIKEIETSRARTAKHVLVPLTMCVVQKNLNRVRLDAVLGSQVAGAP
ncbi:tetratricopeptide repeat protein, partial [Candidatus Phycosocius spiralis]|uniref:tetratricopeptide repeat protein n=1 Tax=Candidatus Phycosocius spiralis TaxID=2815099 RepID=UPI0024E12FA9